MNTNSTHTEGTGLSGNAAPRVINQDRRVRRSRDRLGDAIFALLQERPLDQIRVQDVLDRAGVSRATFYTHYRDKNDLFLSDMDDFFAQIATALSRSAEKSKRVAPVRELFAHIAEMRPFYNTLVESGRQHDVIALAQAHFACGIEQRMMELGRASDDRTERSALAHSLAGALIALLMWWIQRGSPLSPGKMDQMFHQHIERLPVATRRG